MWFSIGSHTQRVELYKEAFWSQQPSQECFSRSGRCSQIFERHNKLEPKSKDENHQAGLFIDFQKANADQPNNQVNVFACVLAYLNHPGHRCINVRSRPTL